MQLLDVHLGRPVTRDGLSVFPAWNGAAVSTRGYDLGVGRVAVRECPDNPGVEQLIATNTGPRPALVLEGELLEGGLQNRVSARSAMVRPGTSEVLAVRCVEQGRWSGGVGHTRDGRRAPVSVRAASAQRETWRQVAAIQARHGGGATQSLGDALDGALARADRLVRGLDPLPFQSGVLLCIGGQPVQLEVFDSPRTLAAVWRPLLLAAAVDALSSAAAATPGRRARRFLEYVRQLSGAPDGEASGWDRRSSSHVQLSSLSWRGRDVHAVAVNPRHELVRV